MLVTLYFATNRNHLGSNRWAPTAYGRNFSSDGIENLRFGRVQVEASDEKINKFLHQPTGNGGKGNGVALSEYLSKCAKKANILAYEESINPNFSDKLQPAAKFGSKAMFAELMLEMQNTTDVMVYIHGFNVSWHEAVGSALSLQLMLQNSSVKNSAQNLIVVLFTWPSDGMALPFVSYKSDRSEAKGSGAAIGRGFLKVRDYLAELRDRAKQEGIQICGQDIHLLCHSMGNYLLESALQRMWQHTPGEAMPRLFEHIFMCAPDVDDDALEAGKPLEKLHQIARHVTLYHNRHDKAMVVSDYTKGNPERLGGAGAAHPNLLHAKVHQVDCTHVADSTNDFTKHSYYLAGNINSDIRQSTDGVAQEDSSRARKLSGVLNSVWTLV